MQSEEIQARMAELMIPVDQAIMNCDDNKDVLMLASIMMSTAKSMYVSVLGKQGAMKVMRGCINSDNYYN